jgi:glycosyltransferase involved in cell wall biosynthesis
MLSIIISSHKQIFFDNLSKNIEKTIGNVAYEVIQIWNPALMGICEAYNKGAQQAKYDFLIFMHEDIEFLTENWGETLVEKYFSLPNVGLLGLAGDKQKFKMPYGFSSGLQNNGFISVYHKLDDDIKKIDFPVAVKVLDGVFLAMKKNIWKKNKFDENLNGFHFYDIDISLRLSENYQNFMITDFFILHFSEGNFGNQWVEAAIDFNKRNYNNFDKTTFKNRERIRRFCYKRLMREEICLRLRLKYLFAMGVYFQSFFRGMKFLFNTK